MFLYINLSEICHHMYKYTTPNYLLRKMKGKKFGSYDLNKLCESFLSEKSIYQQTIRFKITALHYTATLLHTFENIFCTRNDNGKHYTNILYNFSI